MTLTAPMHQTTIMFLYRNVVRCWKIIIFTTRQDATDRLSELVYKVTSDTLSGVHGTQEPFKTRLTLDTFVSVEKGLLFSTPRSKHRTVYSTVVRRGRFVSRLATKFYLNKIAKSLSPQWENSIIRNMAFTSVLLSWCEISSKKWLKKCQQPKQNKSSIIWEFWEDITMSNTQTWAKCFPC